MVSLLCIGAYPSGSHSLGFWEYAVGEIVNKTALTCSTKGMHGIGVRYWRAPVLTLDTAKLVLMQPYLFTLILLLTGNDCISY